MGRKAGVPKETVTIRLTPSCRIRIHDLKTWRQRQAIFSGKKYTNSLVIEQAVNIYYDIVNAELHDETRCGRCRQKRPYD